MKKRFLLVLGILLLVLVSAAFAQNESEDVTLETIGVLNETEELVVMPPTETEMLAKEINAINLELATLNSQIQSALGTIQTLINDLQTIKSQQGSFSYTLDKINQDINAVSTGMGSLQTEATLLEEQVTQLEESRSFTKKAIFLFILFAAFGGVLFYLFYYKRKPSPHPELKKHVHKHLQKGRTYSSIRSELVDAGWNAGHVDSAYKNILAYRYKKYLRAKPKGSLKKPALDLGKKKVIIIAGVSILLLAGVFFLLSGTIGKAIQTQRIFAHEEPFICTPPHIVTEGGCCLDQNSNNICDLEEEYEKGRTDVSAAVCHDHRDCITGEVCIDNSCGIISDLYRTDCPGQDKCSINKIQVLTSDGETYTLHAKKGSYTAAGALAWTIRPIPNYCKGEMVKVPVEIEKTDLVCYDDLGQIVSCDQGTDITCRTDQECTACPDLYGIPCYCHAADSAGRCVKDVIDEIDVQIVSKEIVTLMVGQTTEKMTHPNPNVDKKLGGFTLTLQDVNEFCFPG